MHFLASKDCLGHFWAPSLMTRVTGVGPGHGPAPGRRRVVPAVSRGEQGGKSAGSARTRVDSGDAFVDFGNVSSTMSTRTFFRNPKQPRDSSALQPLTL